ncbi:hypothetical protein EVJ58_g9717 [Rhodofomes roseus]|uniref:Uncharacterized protein n=1 Tax=Rhodofomes roseus TaxID=34475 RepID=A0A4Y9XS38_9APHY|nr:hypothetical protein EVJ58_g9717 [Rhodofomes roseus]
MHPSAFQRVSTPRSALATPPTADPLPETHLARPKTAQGRMSSPTHANANQNTSRPPDAVRFTPGRPGSPSFADALMGRRSASPRTVTGMPEAPRLTPYVYNDDIPPLDLGATGTSLAIPQAQAEGHSEGPVEARATTPAPRPAPRTQ